MASTQALLQLAVVARKSPQQQFEIIEKSKNGLSLVVHGRKLPPLARRIVLDCSDFKVASAKVWRLDKKGDQELELLRINHLPSRQQVRLHTKEMVFPGKYRLELETK